MSTALNWNRGSRLIIKSGLLVLLGMVVFSLLGVASNMKKSLSESLDDSNEETPVETDELDISKRFIERTDDRFRLRRRYQNPCFRYPDRFGEFICFPFSYVIGFEPIADDFLLQAINKHEKVLSIYPPTNFFSNYGVDLNDIGDEELITWMRTFSDEANLIRNNKEHKTSIIVDGGNYLTRDYVPEDGHPIGIEEMTFTFLKHLNRRNKILLVFRNPTNRAYAEYCRKFGPNSSPQHFESLVVSAVQIYNDCFNGSAVLTCTTDRAIIDAAQINIGIGLYNNWWQQLALVYHPTHQFIYFVHFQDLFHVDRINDVMGGVFRFLQVGPTTFDFTQLLGNGDTGHCQGIPMTDTARNILDEFYKNSNEEMEQYTGDPTFLSYLPVQQPPQPV